MFSTPIDVWFSTFFLVLWLSFIMFLWNTLWNKKSVKKTFYSVALSTPRCIAGAVLLERRHSGRQTDVQTFIHVYWKSKQKKRIIWLVLGYAQHTFLEFISDGSGPKLHTLKNSLPHQKRMRYYSWECLILCAKLLCRSWDCKTIDCNLRKNTFYIKITFSFHLGIL